MNANIFCKICTSSDLKYKKKVRDGLHHLPGEWALKKCNLCGVHFLSDPPNSDEINFYYPRQKYYTHRKPSPDSFLLKTVYDYYYGKSLSLTGYFAYKILRKTVNMFPPYNARKENRLLDIGCGNGKLMLRYRKYGFKCFGYEVDNAAISIARKNGLIVFKGKIFDLKKTPEYDVIILNQVLEHLHSPREIMNEVENLIDNQGVLIISVPNSACIDFYLLKDSWTSFQAPTHLFHYNRKSLEYLAHISGFKVKDMAFASSLTSIKGSYIFGNVRNVLKMNGCSLSSILQIMAFLLSSFLAFFPYLNNLKRNRITLYCQPLRIKKNNKRYDSVPNKLTIKPSSSGEKPR